MSNQTAAVRHLADDYTNFLDTREREGESMNHITNTAAAMPEAGKPCNPHCAPQWPFNLYRSHDIAGVHHAVTAALEVAQLLAADDAIRADMESSDVPEDEPQPFKPTCRVGLRAALVECLHSANARLECMADVRTTTD